MDNILKIQLKAIRAGMVSVVAQVDAMLASDYAPSYETTNGCQHPLEARSKAAVMGQPDAWVCRCGYHGGVGVEG